jgi:hypothetical protein
MINFTKEGEIAKIGLNLFKAGKGFVAIWFWFNPSTFIATKYRFRLRLGLKFKDRKKILLSKESYDLQLFIKRQALMESFFICDDYARSAKKEEASAAKACAELIMERIKKYEKEEAKKLKENGNDPK